MSNWNENIGSPGKCTICGYYKYDSICDCPLEFRELQCESMEEKYYNCTDENGNRYRKV